MNASTGTALVDATELGSRESTGTGAILLSDDFGRPLPRGRVIGSRTAGGDLRLGADAAGTMAIDGEALRIGHFPLSGWGRQGIAYGPFRREPGLAFAAFVLNAHNNGQTSGEPPRLLRQMKRWSARWLMRWWPQRRFPPPPTPRYVDPPMRNNLAAGFFASAAPADPTAGHAFVMTATGGANGTLRAGRVPVVESVQNLPAYYVVVLREGGAAYYTCSYPGSNVGAPFGMLRPVSIDADPGDEQDLFAGVWQGVSGEAGFRIDTRVYGARVARLPGLSSWFGSAHAADRLNGSGPLGGSVAEAGGNWMIFGPGFTRSDRGASANGAVRAINDAQASLAEPPVDATRAEPAIDNASAEPAANVFSLAILTPERPTGLIHAFVHGSGAGLLWRFQDESNYWCLRIERGQPRVLAVIGGVSREVATGVPLRTSDPVPIQILDDGLTIRITAGGRPAFLFADARLSDACGTGIAAASGRVHSFESHPRSIALPPELDLGTPWQPSSNRIVLGDDLAGDGCALDKRVLAWEDRHPPIQAGNWERTIGRGVFLTSLDRGTRVAAEVDRPNPGRTAYTIPWDAPEADIAVEITPPGTAREGRDRGRGGLVFWQDADNYLIVNCWYDAFYDGSSVSSFLRLDGREDPHRAVWSNVGDRIVPGVPFTLRLAGDGLHYVVWVDGEPVLFRSLRDVYPGARPLRIRRVGIAANWEWGDDTGSHFRNFVARKA